MRAVAHRLLGGRLAAAEVDLLGFGGVVFQRRDAGVLVGAVAERLLGRLAAGAPPVGLAGFDIDEALSFFGAPAPGAAPDMTALSPIDAQNLFLRRFEELMADLDATTAKG